MRAFKTVGGVLVSILVVLLLWGVLVEPRLVDTEEETARIPGLPDSWSGARVAVVADYQVGMWWSNTGTMRRITERIVEERPAAVLLAGDFVYKAGPDPRAEIDEVVEILRPLVAAGIPTFAVLGNHDYSLNKEDDPRDVEQARRVERALEAAGIAVLGNESARLERRGSAGEPGEALHLVGIGSEWAGEADPAAALRGVPEGAPRIVFMHNPESFTRLPAGTAPLAIAGHTHGGQVRIPGTPTWSWLRITAPGEAHADGWIRDPDFGAAGNRLYVNRGVGFSTVPIRINCRPELTLLTLTGG